MELTFGTCLLLVAIAFIVYYSFLLISIPILWFLVEVGLRILYFIGDVFEKIYCKTGVLGFVVLDILVFGSIFWLVVN